MKENNHIEIRKLIREELMRLNESILVTLSSEILYNIGNNVPDLKRISSNSMVDGSEGLYRYKDGNAYEIQIRPVKYANDKENWKKLTSKKIKTSGVKVTSEDMKQALWLAFKETADKIEYVGDYAGTNKFKITHNDTFDVNNLNQHLKGLEDSGIGVFELDRIGDGFVIITHKNGTGDKEVFDQVIQQSKY